MKPEPTSELISDPTSDPTLEPTNGWIEYKKLILSDLKELNDDYKGLRGEIAALREDVAGLKVKSGIWGAIAGVIPVAIGLLILFFSR